MEPIIFEKTIERKQYNHNIPPHQTNTKARFHKRLSQKQYKKYYKADKGTFVYLNPKYN